MHSKIKSRYPLISDRLVKKIEEGRLPEIKCDHIDQSINSSGAVLDEYESIMQSDDCLVVSIRIQTPDPTSEVSSMTGNEFREVSDISTASTAKHPGRYDDQDLGMLKKMNDPSDFLVLREIMEQTVCELENWAKEKLLLESKDFTNLKIKATGNQFPAHLLEFFDDALKDFSILSVFNKG